MFIKLDYFPFFLLNIIFIVLVFLAERHVINLLANELLSPSSKVHFELVYNHELSVAPRLLLNPPEAVFPPAVSYHLSQRLPDDVFEKSGGFASALLNHLFLIGVAVGALRPQYNHQMPLMSINAHIRLVFQKC